MHAVNTCSFSVEKGKITALIGPNGSGKTTVFNMISGIIVPDEGRIVFKQQEISAWPIERIANAGIARLFQHSRLFNNLTVGENLGIAVSAKDTMLWKTLRGSNRYASVDEDRIESTLALVHMEKEYLKTARDLSYGQKRLVEIARTLILPHELLLLDEPVAGVNPALRTEIGRLLMHLRSDGESILIIEHDMDFIMGIADIVIVMDEGRVIAQGPPSKIRKNKNVLEAYLGS